MLSWLVFAVVGQVLVYIWMSFHLPFENEWLEKLHSCSLCSGVWIYGILAVALRVDIFAEFFRPTIIGQLATAAITSYLVHIFLIGWKTKHEVIIV